MFYWNDELGRERWVVVDGRFFISRYTSELGKYVGACDKTGVYMYWVDPGHRGRVIDAGYHSALISRKHLLVKHRDDGVYITDYGPDGTGSTNGTLVNGEELRPGIEYRIRPGDNIRLGGRHGDFTLLVGLLGEDGKPVLAIDSRSGKTYLPESIAHAGSSKGIEVMGRIEDKPVVLARIPDKPMDIETSTARVYFDRYTHVLLWSLADLSFILNRMNEAFTKTLVLEIKSIIDHEEFLKAVNCRCSRHVKSKLSELKRALIIDDIDHGLLVEQLGEFLTTLRKDIEIIRII